MKPASRKKPEMRVTQAQVHKLDSALDAIELMCSDASQSVMDQRHCDPRSSLELMAANRPHLHDLAQVSVLAASSLCGLREIADAVRAKGGP